MSRIETLAMCSARDPLTCGFLKVKAYNLHLKDTYQLRDEKDCNVIGEIYKKHCSDIKEFFGMEEYDISPKLYKNNLLSVKEIFRKLGKDKPKCKAAILETFSKDAWEKLEASEKVKHSPGDCKGCLETRKFKLALAQFPVKGNTYISKAKKHGLIRRTLGDITNLTNVSVSAKKMKQIVQKETVKQIAIMKKNTAVVR